ncbi:capsular polysaccharide biosynthesis protein [Acinetobacter lwoffii]|uniref:Capsular polysaccharide biosynthesis protein n=1 Tax=Acinetobacter lwoffii TaxID=28090 RepID=A0AAW8AR99_ACILW|nr:capsular polysaccharide biosynthesis protein [Acinetobacter lwoffii]MDP1370057.1 capsular polysaccharide biosynthesis protein [Acinetobacter lwoffii]MDP1389508.1 capsular polysaccharide biosynthesis protein [Acinetobacter lwoffii]MDP1447129.1 capsular polysaccharide biosynthesis protein [Acinetobacter lwoffii]
MILNQYLEKHNLSNWKKSLNIYHEFHAGWGRKKSFFKAQALAEKKGLKALCLEDGFIRSLGLGKDGYAPLSLVVDEIGIYFDALQSSDLEQLILQPENEELNLRAASAIQTILRHKITKYNQKFLSVESGKFNQNTKHILVIDQTFGDQSIKYAGVTSETFKTMLAQACSDHPQATIWVKTHPDVLAGKAQSHFQAQDFTSANIQVLTDAYNPIELLGYIDEVYVVSSQLGFEALLCGKTVHCFGVPWYAGWGLTDDQYAPLEILNGRRGVKRSLNHLFASAYFHYARYVNPVTRERCECEDIIDLIIPNIEFQKHLGQSYIAYGFSPWKKKFIADFLSFPKLSLKFQRYLKPKKNQPTLAWGKKAQRLKDQNYLNVITVEDGFIRSVGLGATLIRPCSLVFDDVGIYYDATKPSGIENLLNQVNLTEQQLQRARDLQQKLIDLNISKYNVGESRPLKRPQHSRVLLVVGQVEDDMSIQLGGIGIKTNLDLLKQVRGDHPDSYIIYKPHPDVQTGLRVGKISDQDMLTYANRVELNTSILECFEICDEVHTITSLSGFEALIRGLKVYCYGLPFYAGWGLTQDLYSSQRRNNKNVTLETLLYVTLVEYPTYNLPHTQASGIPLVRPEDVIAYIKSQLDQPLDHDHQYKRVLLQLYKKFKK